MRRAAELARFYDVAAPEFDRSFRPADGNSVEDHAYNLERAQTVSAVQAAAHGNLVDVGAGTGYWLPFYLNRVESAVLVEPSAGMREQIERRLGEMAQPVPVSVVAGTHRDLGSLNYDFALISGVLGHFEQAGREEIMSAVIDCLVPGGTLLAMDSMWTPSAAALLPSRHGYARRSVGGEIRSVYKHYFESNEVRDLLNVPQLDEVAIEHGTYFWRATAHRAHK